MTEKKIVSIRGGGQAAAAAEPNEEIIATLEAMLDEAKSGAIQHLVAVTSNGKTAPVDCYIGSGEPEQVMAIIGVMEMCKHTMLMTQYNEQIVAQ